MTEISPVMLPLLMVFIGCSTAPEMRSKVDRVGDTALWFTEDQTATAWDSCASSDFVRTTDDESGTPLTFAWKPPVTPYEVYEVVFATYEEPFTACTSKHGVEVLAMVGRLSGPPSDSSQMIPFAYSQQTAFGTTLYHSILWDSPLIVTGDQVLWITVIGQTKSDTGLCWYYCNTDTTLRSASQLVAEGAATPWSWSDLAARGVTGAASAFAHGQPAP